MPCVYRFTEEIRCSLTNPHPFGRITRLPEKWTAAHRLAPFVSDESLLAVQESRWGRVVRRGGVLASGAEEAKRRISEAPCFFSCRGVWAIRMARGPEVRAGSPSERS